MHYHLSSTDYNIWEYDEFKKIIHVNLLPQNFYNLNNNEKRDILYLYGNYNYLELWEKIQQEKPFWNLNNLKNDIAITNVVIHDEDKYISIEFSGICKFFVAYLELNYEDDFNIDVFDPS